jgi:hypothetical protein
MNAGEGMVCLFVFTLMGLGAFHVLYERDTRREIASEQGITVEQLGQQINAGQIRLLYGNVAHRSYLQLGAFVGLLCGAAIWLGVFILKSVRPNKPEILLKPVEPPESDAEPI